MSKSLSGSHTLIVQPDDGRTLVLNNLNAAKKSIDLTIYEISDDQIVAALKAAHNRKVKVQVIYNWYSFDTDEQQRDVMPTIKALQAAGIQCKEAPKKFEVTHEKAFVIDGTTAIIMSFNLTSEYFSDTRDFGIVTTVPAEVEEVAAVFAADWADKAITPTVPSLVWSPVNSRTKLTNMINNATKTLDIYCEEAEDPGTLGAMVAAAKRGVTVRFIAALLTGNGTANGNAQGITFLKNGGVNAVCKSFPIAGGTVQMYIHAKMILADNGTANAQAYIGSENFSCVSLDDNRECGIIVTEPAILERLQTTYNSDWAQPSIPVTPNNTPLQACMGDQTARAKARVQVRSFVTSNSKD
jgi:cardiolipin synthase A/B